MLMLPNMMRQCSLIHPKKTTSWLMYLTVLDLISIIRTTMRTMEIMEARAETVLVADLAGPEHLEVALAHLVVALVHLEVALAHLVVGPVHLEVALAHLVADRPAPD